uniref:Uncharacterized protein n=1 Tax=Oryzias latipes TaxID=8090 RepID=A0A3P9HJH9_ORYLA
MSFICIQLFDGVVAVVKFDVDAASASCCCCCCSDCSARWVLSCLRRLDDTTNDFRHSSHLKGLSPECTRRCLLRLERSANDLSHSVHEKGRRPVWTSMWRRRSQDATKALSQLWHLYGPGCRKRLEHLSQGYGLKPEWARWCRRKLEGSENILPHCGQRNGFSPE